MSIVPADDHQQGAAAIRVTAMHHRRLAVAGVAPESATTTGRPLEAPGLRFWATISRKRARVSASRAGWFEATSVAQFG